MPEPIDWQKLPEKERVRLLLQHVMGCFILDDSAYNHGHDLKIAKGMAAPVGFHWPVAYWNSDVECWQTEDIATHPLFFDPLHDLNDTWKVVKQALARFAIGSEEIRHFLEGLMEHSAYALNAYTARHFLVELCTPERLCIAALKAVGIEIEE